MRHLPHVSAEKTQQPRTESPPEKLEPTGSEVPCGPAASAPTVLSVFTVKQAPLVSLTEEMQHLLCIFGGVFYRISVTFVSGESGSGQKTAAAAAAQSS